MRSPDAFCGQIINDLDLWHLSIVALSELPFIMHCRPSQERGQEDLSATIDMYMKKDKFPWIYGRSFRLPSTKEFAFIRVLASLLSQFAPNASRILRLRFLNWTFNLIYSDYAGRDFSFAFETHSGERLNEAKSRLPMKKQSSGLVGKEFVVSCFPAG